MIISKVVEVYSSGRVVERIVARYYYARDHGVRGVDRVNVRETKGQTG